MPKATPTAELLLYGALFLFRNGVSAYWSRILSSRAHCSGNWNGLESRCVLRLDALSTKQYQCQP